MGKLKKRGNTHNSINANPLTKSKNSYAHSKACSVAASAISRKSSKSNIFEELQLDTVEMEEELEDSVVRQLSGHKEWLVNKKAKNKNTTASDDNLVSVLKSLSAVPEGGMECGRSGEDARSVVTSKSFKGLGLRKKQKKDLKKQVWLKKIALTEKHMSINELSIIQKTTPPLFDDLSSLNQSLSTVKWLNSASRSSGSTKHRSIEKEKTIKQNMREDLRSFSAGSLASTDPFGAAKQQLLRKMKMKES